MARATAERRRAVDIRLMPLRVAIVAHDAEAREAAARAFDGAPPDWKISLHDAPPQDADVLVAAPGAKVAGAVELDPDHPEATLEAVAARRTGRCIAVCAASGGAGATTLSLLLARSLARRSSVCVLELQRGIAPRLELSDALRCSDWEPEQEIRRFAHPVPGGFRVLLEPADAAATLRRALHTFEVVVVDASARSFPAGPVDALLVVCTPAASSAARVTEVTARVDARAVGLIVNHTGPGGTLSSTRVAKTAGRTATVEIPLTPSLRDLEEDGRVDVPWWSRAARPVDSLAATLVQR